MPLQIICLDRSGAGAFAIDSAVRHDAGDLRILRIIVDLAQALIREELCLQLIRILHSDFDLFNTVVQLKRLVLCGLDIELEPVRFQLLPVFIHIDPDVQGVIRIIVVKIRPHR